MPTVAIQGRTFEVTHDGFLEDPSIWDNEVARLFASAEGITELTDDHWKVISYLRTYYIEHGNAPMVRQLCKGTGCKLTELYELFSVGPRGLCKVAGLPSASGCL